MNPRDPLTKIKKPDTLKRVIARYRGAKRKIVFTNGVFDILHCGHVTYLNRARKLGSLLIVALNEDDSVKKLKGPKRPVNRLSDRMLTLAGLECVDYVTWFGEETPLKLINLLQPNVLVKGGDYKISEIIGADEVVARGGMVKALPYIEGYSTSQIIQRMK